MKQYSNRFKAWGQFDRYCKVVLKHEAINYFRELQRHRTKTLETLRSQLMSAMIEEKRYK